MDKLQLRTYSVLLLVDAKTSETLECDPWPCIVIVIQVYFTYLVSKNNNASHTPRLKISSYYNIILALPNFKALCSHSYPPDSNTMHSYPQRITYCKVLSTKVHNYFKSQ